jgi:pre-mRNA-splicing helicase BRR2
VNSYPTLEVTFELVKGDYKAGSPINLKVFINDGSDEDDDEPENNQPVVAPFYPATKSAHWWLVVGEPSTRQLLAIKRITVRKTLTINLDFTLSKGTHNLKLYAICDSYTGADHDLAVGTVEVAEGEDSDSDDDMSDVEE